MDCVPHLYLSVYCCVTTQQNATFWDVGTWDGAYDPQIRTLLRFLYNALSCQISSSRGYHSEVIMLTNEQTHKPTNKQMLL